MPKLEKGEHAPLNVTQKAKHRVFAGLGWEPHTENNALEKIGVALGLAHTNHDLDLSCLLFDGDKNLVSVVSTAPGHGADMSGHVYHSGDNTGGEGDGDDEQISVELLELGPAIQYILFAASIKSGHVFGDIDSPVIRLADGYSNHNFLQAALDHPEGRGKNAFAFASLYRAGNGWNIHNISRYLDDAALQKPNGALSDLLENL